MAERPHYWLEPITAETRKPHACLTCEMSGAMPVTFPPDGVIAVGFGFAACTKDGAPVLVEPEVKWSEDFAEILWEPGDEDYPTGAKAEELALADPDHDWRIVIHGPLSGREYQRQGVGNWVLVAQDEGFA